MARIRTIKPEFWTSEQTMELSFSARLAFIGLWNFCDDAGVHPASCKTLKAEIFPSDEISADEVSKLVAEMVSQGLVAEFEADGKRYWHVTGWEKHQKIDRPTYRHPRPDKTSNDVRMLAEPSPTTRRTLDEPSPPESKGVEGNGVEDSSGADAPVVAGKPADSLPCPVEKIVELYHQHLPGCPKVRILNESRRKTIRQRWREAARLETTPFGYTTQSDGLAAWGKFFEVCGYSEFLTGKVPGRGGSPPFVADLDFLVGPKGFTRALENKYHRGVE